MNSQQEEAVRKIMTSDVEYIIGIDEVGLGAWAGPLVVAGVVMPRAWGHPDVKDSKAYNATKKLSAHERRRKVLYSCIKPAEKFSLVRSISSEEVDKMGVSVVLDGAIREIAKKCYGLHLESLVVVDGAWEPGPDFLPPDHLIVTPKADSIIPAVSAASVLAKVTRDTMMIELHQTYPQYGFDKHVGYGTPEHKKAIEAHGLCPAHRRSYRPIQEVVGGN